MPGGHRTGRPGTVRLVAWNILHGGGTKRTPEIVLRLCELSPDLVVLTEFRRAMGGQIAGVLFDRGLVNQAWTDPPSGRNGVFVASRTRIEPGEIGPGPGFEHRWLDVRLPEIDTTLTAIHAPDTHRSDADRIQRQAVYWQHLVRLGEARRASRHVVIGDLNTGRHRLDEDGETFTGTWFLGRFWTLGYRDAYRLREPSARAETWRSHTGSGFRIDAAWVSEGLRDAVKTVSHDDSARRRKVSDHAPLVVELTVGTVGVVPTVAKNTEKTGVGALAGPRVVR
jgi:exonuclease III